MKIITITRNACSEPSQSAESNTPVYEELDTEQELSTEIQEALSPEIQNTEEKHRLRKLVVFNDDINTFEHVIKTLMLICRHEPHQAEQCAYLIHHRGKCTVREGTYVQLLPMRKGIVNAGIFAEIL